MQTIYTYEGADEDPEDTRWLRVIEWTATPEDDETAVNVEVTDEEDTAADIYLSRATARDFGRALLTAAGDDPSPSLSNPSDLSDPRRAWNDHVFGLAAQFGRLVIFDYQKDGSVAIERRKLRPDTVEDGVATGHDLARSDIRAFRLDRVQGWARVG